MDRESISSKSIVSGLVWKTAERILAQVVSFVVSLVLARLLNPSDYGTVALVLVFISLADVFVSSGFSTALIQKKDANETDFSTIFYCSLGVSILLYAVLFFTAPYIALFYSNESLVIIVRVFSLRIPISVYNSVQHAYVSRNMLFKRFFWSTLIGTIISGIVGILLAYKGFGVWALVAQYFTNTIIDTLVLAITVPWHPKFLFSWSSARQLMNYGWKILAADLSGTFFGQLRSLIIGRIYSTADLAYYNKGQQIPSLVYNNIGSSTMAVLFPAISNVGDKIEQAKYLTRRAMYLLSYVLLPLFCGIAAVAPELIKLLLTDKWSSSIIYTQIICFSYAFATLGIASFQALKAIGRSDIVLKLEFIKKPVYVLLLIIGVKINVLAVAITMAAYDLYGTFMNSIQVKKYLKYSFKEQLQDVASPVFLSAIMFTVVFLIKLPFDSIALSFMAKVFIGIVIYIGGSLLFKVKAFYYIISFLKSGKKGDQ